MQEMQDTQVQSLGQEDPLRRKWQPNPVFLPGKFHGQRSLVAIASWLPFGKLLFLIVGITAYFLPRLPTIRKSSFPKGSQEAIGGITTTKTKSQCPLCQASRAMDVTERGLKCKQEARFSTPCSATNLLRILNSRWISSSLTNTWVELMMFQGLF